LTKKLTKKGGGRLKVRIGVRDNRDYTGTNFRGSKFFYKILKQKKHKLWFIFDLISLIFFTIQPYRSDCLENKFRGLA